MNPNRTVNLLQILFVAFTSYLGFLIGDSFWEFPRVGTYGGVAFGLLIVLADRLLQGMSLRMFSSATFGLFIGFLASRLLLASGLLRMTQENTQWLISLSVYATFSYIGMMLAMRSNRDEFALIIPYIRFRDQHAPEQPVLVDSNIIIDGRLPDLAATGFLSSTFIVPRFVLEELQTLADSHDPAKREKGRLALSRLQEMQSNSALQVSIHESTLEAFSAVDSKLVQLAKILDTRLLSNDGNLCAIARLQGVVALNLNDLSKIMRPALSSGDEFDLTLTKEGREPDQAVGYLGDGTMVIVNRARSQMGRTVRVIVSSTLQTSAGRLFFAELKAA